MIKDIKKEDAKKKFLSMPEEIKDMILDLDMIRQVKELAQKNNLRVDDMETLLKIVDYTMLGFIRYDKFGDVLVEELKVSPEIAKNIAKDVDGFAFSKIRILSLGKEVSDKDVPVLKTPQTAHFAPPPFQRPPMTPFINTGKIESRFEPWKNPTPNATTANIGVPNYTNKPIAETAKENFPTIETGAQNKPSFISNTETPKQTPPLPTSATLVSSKTPFAQTIELVSGARMVPPGQEIKSVPKTPLLTQNDTQARIGKEISIPKTNTLSQNIPTTPNKVPVPPYGNFNFQRGKFGQGMPPAINTRSNVSPQNISAMPKNIPEKTTEETSRPLQNQNLKTEGVFKASSGQQSYKVDPYRESVG